MQKLRWDMFPDIQYGDKIYQADAHKKLCPLAKIVLEKYRDGEHARILLSGEGAIGKSSSILATRLNLIKEEGAVCFYVNLKFFNHNEIEKIKDLCLTKYNNLYTVVLLDAHDELREDRVSLALNGIDELNQSEINLIVATSRYFKEEKKPIEDDFCDDNSERVSNFETFKNFEQAILLRLNNNQIFNNIGNDFSIAETPVFDLLHNTMFLSMYLKMGEESRNSVREFNQESIFILEYFKQLYKIKNFKVRSLHSNVFEIGEGFYKKCFYHENYSGYLAGLPLDYIYSVNNGMLSSIHKKFSTFALGYYIATVLSENSDEDIISVFQMKKGRLSVYIDRDIVYDAFSYAGQLVGYILKSRNNPIEIREHIISVLGEDWRKLERNDYGFIKREEYIFLTKFYGGFCGGTIIKDDKFNIWEVIRAELMPLGVSRHTYVDDRYFAKSTEVNLYEVARAESRRAYGELKDWLYYHRFINEICELYGDNLKELYVDVEFFSERYLTVIRPIKIVLSKNVSSYCVDWCSDSKICAIDVEHDNKNFIMLDGLLYNREMTKLIRVPPKSNFKEVKVFEGVKEIAADAFYGCGLERIYLPKDVKIDF